MHPVWCQYQSRWSTPCAAPRKETKWCGAAQNHQPGGSSRLMSTFTSPPKQAVLSWLQTHSHLSTVAIDGFWCCCVWSRPPGPHTLSAHPPPPLPPNPSSTHHPHPPTPLAWKLETWDNHTRRFQIWTIQDQPPYLQRLADFRYETTWDQPCWPNEGLGLRYGINLTRRLRRRVEDPT